MALPLFRPPNAFISIHLHPSHPRFAKGPAFRNPLFRYSRPGQELRASSIGNARLTSGPSQDCCKHYSRRGPVAGARSRSPPVQRVQQVQQCNSERRSQTKEGPAADRKTPRRKTPRMSSSQFPPPLSYSSGQGAISNPSVHSPPGILSPGSTNSIYATPDSAHQPFYLAKSEPDDGASTGSSVANGPASTEPLKKKQKRNKPTLSCYECVERKTKVCFIFLLLLLFFLLLFFSCSLFVFVPFPHFLICFFFCLCQRPITHPTRYATQSFSDFASPAALGCSRDWWSVLRQYDVVLMQSPIAHKAFARLKVHEHPNV